MLRLALIVVALLAAMAPAEAAPWLFVADVHYDPAAQTKTPARYGKDTNRPLLDSALRAMQAADPDPPVVLIAGDFLPHHFDWRRGPATMSYLAQRFKRAFPHAQFIITLGNEDSPCGDYGVPASSAFLRQVARAWEPLVNRNGAAPDFERTFPRDGSYTARVAAAHLTVTVIDDVFWSALYHACAPSSGNGANETLGDLRRDLRENGTHWVLLHIPPGIDAFSTAHLTHRLVDVPFLRPGARSNFEQLVDDPADHVGAVIAGHTHKFAYRILGTPGHPIPALLLPSVSPVLGNAPGFAVADVDAQATISDFRTYAFDGETWFASGGFPALGVRTVDGAALVGLQARLAQDPALRATFDRLYGGGAHSEITEGNWRVYWCAATAFSATNFRRCLGEGGGISVVSTRGIVAAAGAVLLVLGVATAFVVWARLRSGRTAPPPT